MDGLFSGEDIGRLHAIGQLMFLLTARPLGVALLFTAFAWGHLNSGILRLGFAAAIALPLLAGLSANASAYLDALPAHIALIGLKELFIGVLFGFIAALPFEALVAAGGIIDIYRGSGPSGAGPSGEASPYGQLFMVVGLWLFASLGGFWLLTDAIYASYGLWPVHALLPQLTMDGGRTAFSFVTGLTMLAAVCAAPLLILMAASDLVFLISGKIGKNINITFLSATAKNLLALFVLPLFMLVLIRLFSARLTDFTAVTPVLRALLK